ncbi:translation initiation factor eIF-2 beta subunit [Sporothrix stenoceras]|uniref:Translation initiation factor eIF-2 beta subunit n=1 Tax=Sporothrix stenoceras TaxID=5173 RepID=A0ABR3Z7Z5_9PEZI
MATELPTSERKPRKSVAFTEEALVIDADGHVTMPSTEAIDDTKDTAVSHSPRSPALSAALESAADAAAAAAGAAATGEDGLDLSLLKKKKKKSTKKKAEGDEEGAEGDAPAGDDGGLDLTLKKKKKKKSSKDKAAAEDGDEFAEKLKALELRDGAGDESEAVVEEGDMDKGTGIWQHDAATPPIPFTMLLSRFYHVLELKNPDHATSGSRSYKIPPPQCMREGNKKTIFANITEVAKRMKRTEDHITLYLLAELGTTGSVDGSRRLVIRGRFQQKQIENVLRKYIIEYVVCKTCKSPDTELSKGENRLYFITCNSCGSRRSVTAIKTGFSAQVGKRKKTQG